MAYPKLVVNRARILENAKRIRKMAAEHGIRIMPVVKGLGSHPAIVRALDDAGFEVMGDANLFRMDRYAADIQAELWLLRCPAISELPHLVDVAKGTLVTEAATLQALEALCAKRGITFKAMLVAELGDLREGSDETELKALAKTAEALPHIRLAGMAANLACLNSIVPDENNMAVFAREVQAVEDAIGRRLGVVSGGNSASFGLMAAGKLPDAVNELRFGEAIILGNLPCWDKPIDGLYQKTATLYAEVAEVKEKPSKPWGTFVGIDGFSAPPTTVDRGIRKRAIVIVGMQTMHVEGVRPKDAGITLVGATSDYMILDVTDCPHAVRVGDVLAFDCDYNAVATGMASLETVLTDDICAV